MPIPIEVAGLDAFAAEVPDGSLVLVEGGLAPAKSRLARTIAESSTRLGRPTVVWTTRPASSERPGQPATEMTEWHDGAWPAGHDVVVDSFSLMSLGASASEVAARLRAVRRACQARGNVAVLVVDEGQMAPAAVAVAHHLADGVIQFHARDDDEGAVPYLRVPKWMGTAGAQRNLYYGFDGTTIFIDTRRRVN